MNKETKLIILVSIFVTGLATSFAIASKIVSLFGLTFSASALAYAITFLMTDTIAEVWGKKKARKIIWIGLLSMIVTVILVYIAIMMPGAPFWDNQEGYEATLGLVGRFLIASILAYLISQHHDIWAFHFWKDLTSGKHLWLRNNASTFVSQFIDTVIFIGIAFYGVLPNNVLLLTILGQFVVKIVIAAIDTPIVYALVGWARK